MNWMLGLTVAILVLATQLTPLLAAEGLDVTRLGPIEARLVAPGGRAPVLSPDGKRLLFAKRPNSDWFDEWWLVGVDGKGARLLFRSARDPVWSPDGNRIALNRYMGKVVIYDLAKGKEFEVFRNEGSRDVNGPWWTGDGNALVFRDAVMANTEQNVPYLLDLDNLTAREIRTERRQSEGWPGEVDEPEVYIPARGAGFRLECRPDAQPFSANVAYTDGSLAALGDPFGNAFQGLWALSMDSRYAVRLHGKAPCLQASLAPKVSRAAWATPEGVWVGKLATRPSPWNSRFALPFGQQKGVQPGMHLVVYSKRVNPLNGKIVGAKTDDVRGALRVQAVQDENSVAELVEWTGKPIRPDDVAYFQSARVSNVFAQADSVLDLGATLGKPLGPDAWEAPKVATTQRQPVSEAATRAKDTPPAIVKLWQQFPSLTEFDSAEAYKRLSTWLPDRGLRGQWLKVSQVIPLSRIEELAGVRVFLGGPHGRGVMNLGAKDSFGRYNPEFVGWLGQHAVPPRTEEFQAIYDRFFRRIARGYYAAFEDLRAAPAVREGAKRAYLARLGRVDGEPGSFLQETFRERADALAKQGHDWYEVDVAYGFWVRRSIDQTDQKFAGALRALLSVYDPEYLKRP